MKENGYHDAENEVDPDTDDDCDRILSGKLSESSGSAASDLYDYKVLSLVMKNFNSCGPIYFIRYNFGPILQTEWEAQRLMCRVFELN